jgi:hypothetical protein
MIMIMIIKCNSTKASELLPTTTFVTSKHVEFKYYQVYQWLKTGFWLVIGFINRLQVVTTINYYTIADLRNLQSLHTNLLSLFPLVFTISVPATDL